AEDVTHRHVERAALRERESAQVLDEVRLERQSVLVALLYELLARQAEGVARFPRDVREEASEARGVLLLLLQPDVAVNRDETSKLVGRHLVVSFLRAPVNTLDAVHRHAARSEHAPNFGEHRVLLFKRDVAEHVEAHNVVET